MSTAESSEEIQREMLRIRSEVRDDVEGIFDRAEQLTDWRYYVRRHPWLCVAAAAAVGYFVVPQSHRIVMPDADALVRAVKQAGISPDHSAAPVRSTWLQAGLGIAGSILARQAVSIAGRKLNEFLDSQRDAR